MADWWHFIYKIIYFKRLSGWKPTVTKTVCWDLLWWWTFSFYLIWYDIHELYLWTYSSSYLFDMLSHHDLCISYTQLLSLSYEKTIKHAALMTLYYLKINWYHFRLKMMWHHSSKGTSWLDTIQIIFGRKFLRQVICQLPIIIITYLLHAVMFLRLY